MDLFEQEKTKNDNEPLAVRMRPKSLDEFIGQAHLMAEGKILRRNIEADRLTSLVLWGPPGVGKTSLGEIIALKTKAKFVYLNGSFTTASDIKRELQAAGLRMQQNKRTILFIDEIHRLNRLQQDFLIPDTENSRIILIGATTYNPFFYINPALISRSLVCELKPLTSEDILAILKRALVDKERGLGQLKIKIDKDTLEFIAQMSSGDARRALSALEVASLTTPKGKGLSQEISKEIIKETVQLKQGFYDKKGDYHYDVISAFIKSVRGSDADAALYWLARMLYSGEDPRFIARRLTILASEDIGLANPFALVLATSCFQAVEFVGMPEARIILAEVTVYLARSLKSNSAYLAIESAQKDVAENPIEEVPLHLKGTGYSQAKTTGRGADYKYPHDFSEPLNQKYRSGAKKYYFPKSSQEETGSKTDVSQQDKKNT